MVIWKGFEFLTLGGVFLGGKNNSKNFGNKQDQKSIDAIESDLISEPGLIFDDSIIEELTDDGCSGPVVVLMGCFNGFFLWVLLIGSFNRFF